MEIWTFPSEGICLPQLNLCDRLQHWRRPFADFRRWIWKQIVSSDFLLILGAKRRAKTLWRALDLPHFARLSSSPDASKMQEYQCVPALRHDRFHPLIQLWDGFAVVARSELALPHARSCD